MSNEYSLIIIGGGPAGLSAAVAAGNQSVLLIEREDKLGGILKQCIHDGFGVIRFGQKLSGPEYAYRFAQQVMQSPNVTIKLQTFVVKIEKQADRIMVQTTSAQGIETYYAPRLILANGCRERTARQVSIHGTRPQGIMTAGVAQNYVNLLGALPTQKCVILGSGDIGLIMARRLTLEGARVLGVYEAKATPSGLSRNLQQCLYDFDIPLHLSTTVTRVFGEGRVTGVETASVDEKMNPIPGTEQYVECDGLVISVGLIPENELAEELGIRMDRATKGPLVDQNMMTSVDGVYSVGNALHVHDLVDYVSETAETAARATALTGQRQLVEVEKEGFLYLVPQMLDVASLQAKTLFYFRSARDMATATLTVTVDGQEVFTKKMSNLKPPEMERLAIPLSLSAGSRVKLTLSEGK